ncbi:MAG: GMC family oxidoreductase [Pseudomonadota bacterium]
MNADVVIVGSGAGGSAAAWALTQRGINCTILEAGPHYDFATDYKLDQSNWEQHGFPEKIPTAGRQVFAPMQKLSKRWDHLRSWNHIRGPSNVTGVRTARGGYKHVVGVGGTTLYFTGEYHRMNRRSMRMRSDFGVAADWPLTYEELEPYYTQAERLVGTSGGGADHRRPRSDGYPLPPLPMSYATRQLQKGHEALGLTFESNPLAVLSKPFDGRPSCNFCGNCNRGCPHGDKGSADITFLWHANATGRCRILTDATVINLEKDSGGRIRRAVYARQDGTIDAISAEAFILAAGAIETPRLLLNSDVATGSGHVGKHFMESLVWTSVGIHPDQIGSHRGHPSDGICWDFNDPDALDSIVGGFRLSPGTAEANLVGPINYAARIVGGWGAEHKERMRDLFGRALALTAFGESLPNDKSFIDLDPDHQDAFGLPKARIHSFLPDHELERLTAMRATVRKVLAASQVSDPVEEFGTYDDFDSTHVFGTCRMGQDPATAVVDPNGRCHGSANLFVCDASVFPSSGGGESPSLTIAALAVRTVDKAWA